MLQKIDVASHDFLQHTCRGGTAGETKSRLVSRLDVIVRVSVVLRGLRRTVRVTDVSTT